MLYNLETKTQKLKRSHIIKDVRGEAHGKALTLHLTPRNFYKKNLILEPGCKVTCDKQEFHVVEYGFSKEAHHYLELILDNPSPGEDYTVFYAGFHCFKTPGHMEGDKLVIFTTQRDHRTANLESALILREDHIYRCISVESEPQTHFLILTVKEVDYASL